MLCCICCAGDRASFRLICGFRIEQAIFFSPDPFMQGDLGQRKNDMTLFIRNQLVEQAAGDEIANLVAVFACLDLQVARIMFPRQVAFHGFQNSLTDPQRVAYVWVGMVF